MPSKDMKCEFCDKVFRKNEVGRHTKAKHIPELAQYILQEYIENPTYNCIERYAKGLNPKCNPIYSKVYADCCYYFGANPTFFDEEDSYSTYIKSDDNMKIHNDFLSEVVKSISVYDFIQCQRNIQINSDEIKLIKKQKMDAEELNQQLQKEINTLKCSNKNLQSIVDDFREANECPTTISDMKDELNSLKSIVSGYEREIDNYRYNIKALSEEKESSIYEYMEQANKKRREIEDMLDKIMIEKEKYKKEIDSMSITREAYANTKVEKELKKEKEKYEKTLEKKEEKLKKHYQAEIDELEDEVESLKKQIKKLKRTTKKSSDESESESE
jgi:DNA repair exonuclease SbcCD ATPase subunit